MSASFSYSGDSLCECSENIIKPECIHNQTANQNFLVPDFDFVWSVDRSVTTLTENTAALETRMTTRQKFAWHEPFLTREAELTFRLGD